MSASGTDQREDYAMRCASQPGGKPMKLRHIGMAEQWYCRCICANGTHAIRPASTLHCTSCDALAPCVERVPDDEHAEPPPRPMRVTDLWAETPLALLLGGPAHGKIVQVTGPYEEHDEDGEHYQVVPRGKDDWKFPIHYRHVAA